MCGEEKRFDDKCVQDWLRIWPNVRKRYTNNGILNGEVSGLFFKFTLEKTLSFKYEKCSGGKFSEERITVILSGNLTGTEKKPLTMIGKSKRPISLKTLKRFQSTTYIAEKLV